jgi:hypothetical protein
VVVIEVEDKQSMKKKIQHAATSAVAHENNIGSLVKPLDCCPCSSGTWSYFLNAVCG